MTTLVQKLQRNETYIKKAIKINIAKKNLNIKKHKVETAVLEQENQYTQIFPSFLAASYINLLHPKHISSLKTMRNDKKTRLRDKL